MTGATDSAFRVIAAGLGSSSSLTIEGNEVSGNGATSSYTLGSTDHRGGGLVFTYPFPGQMLFQGNQVSANRFDQVLVAASAGTLDLRGGATCGTSTNNSFGCYDAGAVGVFSNGASVQIDRNHWSQQPAAPTVDYGGTVITGAAAACTPSALTCP